MINNKRTFSNRMLGVNSEKDEREQQIIHSKITEVFLISFCVLLIFSIVSILFDAYNNTFSIGSVLLLVLILFNSISVLITLKKAGVNKEIVNSDRDFQYILQKEKVKCFLASILFIVMAILLNVIFTSLINQQLSFSNLNVLGWIIGGAIFGFLSYIFSKKKIKLEK
ncbi:hypothetical protein [Staphylococcus felis]|uniref:hypothetical protein n=1 Tax=Staphylococcus felis TaxID=46127 RepID=UPI0024804F75|nr:hypothetical protein [Staphylococcus felis]